MKNSTKKDSSTKSAQEMIQAKWENGCIDGKPLI
jgi:hypothetical protein